MHVDARLTAWAQRLRAPQPQADAKVADIASGLKAVGVPVKGRVGVFGANSPEWMITMQASPPLIAFQFLVLLLLPAMLVAGPPGEEQVFPRCAHHEPAVTATRPRLTRSRCTAHVTCPHQSDLLP